MPVLISLHEIYHGVMTPKQVKDLLAHGGMSIKVMLTVDAESVYKSVISADPKCPAEKTLYGHVLWIREQLLKGLLDKIQWCDTRDMTADGHTKGSIARDILLQLMRGEQRFTQAVRDYAPFRPARAASELIVRMHEPLLLDDLEMGDPRSGSVLEGKNRPRVRFTSNK